ncbi:PEP-CTERM sorting domain-containing protein [Planctomycetales bacterium ZRK34]|nr:PEP-CTERM sorting domain-containing protein [Planctomycetales bacterium ZRK34]
MQRWLVPLVAVGVFVVTLPVEAAILDDVTGAAAAWSLRQLDDDYAGPAINVKRTSDGATQDIGFVGGELDTAALLSFVGSSTGLVTTWYDQSGNGRDAIESSDTNRPRIVIDGVLQNGSANIRPGLRYLGNNCLTLLEGLLETNTTISLQEITVAPPSDNSLANRFWNYATSGNSSRFSFGIEADADFGVFRNSGSTVDADSGILLPLHQDIYTVVTNDFSGAGGTHNYDANVNGLDAFTITGTTNLIDDARFVIGAQTPDGDRSLNGYTQEVIIYTSVLNSSQLAMIQADQSAYYIPEPGTFTLVVLGAATLMTRRRQS